MAVATLLREYENGTVLKKRGRRTETDETKFWDQFGDINYLVMKQTKELDNN
jgi:hypothetical protein